MQKRKGRKGGSTFEDFDGTMSNSIHQLFRFDSQIRRVTPLFVSSNLCFLLFAFSPLLSWRRIGREGEMRVGSVVREGGWKIFELEETEETRQWTEPGRSPAFSSLSFSLCVETLVTTFKKWREEPFLAPGR